MTDEERVKEYHAIRDAEEWCDAAHYQFKKYMQKVGSAARYHRQSAINQVETDLTRNKLEATLVNGTLPFRINTFINKCIDASKRDLETGTPIPYASGISSDEDDDSSCYAWAAFFIIDLPSDIDVDKHEELAYELTGWTKHWRGAGRSFSSEPYYTKGRTRILVKQFRGLDI